MVVIGSILALLLHDLVSVSRHFLFARFGRGHGYISCSAGCNGRCQFLQLSELSRVEPRSFGSRLASAVIRGTSLVIATAAAAAAAMPVSSPGGHPAVTAAARRTDPEQFAVPVTTAHASFDPSALYLHANSIFAAVLVLCALGGGLRRHCSYALRCSAPHSYPAHSGFTCAKRNRSGSLWGHVLLSTPP